MRVPRSILARYSPALDDLRWTPISGGFSGANVWRGDDPTTFAPHFSLKAWQPEMSAERLASIHAHLARAGHLLFIPRILPTASFETLVPEAGRCWDVSRWMPGEGSRTLTVAQIAAACAALARLHRCWPEAGFAPCPGVLNRLAVLTDFHTHFAGKSAFLAPVSQKLDALLRRGREAVARASPSAVQALRQWEAVPLRIQPCVRDLRAEHFLFRDSDVTGIVDFGAMANDCPAVDLARFFLNVPPEEECSVFASGLLAYQNAVGHIDFPNDFVRLLARTGAICSVIGWLHRVLVERNTSFDDEAISVRLASLVTRVEHFNPS